MIEKQKHITSEQVAQVVYEAIPRLATTLPLDIKCALKTARQQEKSARGQVVLDMLIENARIGEHDKVPLCQDTGVVWVSLEIGPDISIEGNVFSGVDAAVAKAYEQAHLRKSVVYDALTNRQNTQNNTPAFCDIHVVDAPGVARLHIMLKGGGSDNASRVVMLTPGAGREAITQEILRCVREKGANACPPLLIGIGVGATFDKVANLAKRALMRPCGIAAQNAEVAHFESELLEEVNKTGLGPAGLGGTQTAFAVHIQTAPCHIAALPLAINMGCSAMRRASFSLLDEEKGGEDVLASGETHAQAGGEETCKAEGGEV